MARVFRIGARFVTVVAAYLIACIVTAYAMIAVAVIREARAPIQWTEVLMSGRGWGAITAYALFALAVILPVSIIPTAFAVVYAEQKQVRSVAAFAGFGAMVGFAACWYVLLHIKQGHQFGMFPSGSIPSWVAEPLYFACFGAAGGAVYWLLAGRRSGSACRDPSAPSSRTVGACAPTS